MTALSTLVHKFADVLKVDAALRCGVRPCDGAHGPPVAYVSVFIPMTA